ncbi:MAG: hypothetical protein DMF89_15260 [Acidobacteria bacterium]|nr:MAG: hypothetical protein DMF89_15260 [Acidobacteriota bacterium]
MAGTTEPFSRQGSYRAVYHIIAELPFYRQATDLHMQWIRSIKNPRPLIIEAGGGTGIMNAEARRVRTDADVYLVDVNPAMAERAESHGVPRNKVIIADIRQMSVDRSCVLKAGGTLAVSTVGENLHRYRQYFLDYLDEHLSAAVRRGTVSPEHAMIFLEQNKRITEAATSPLSARQLRELGERHGLEAEVLADCYVVNSPEGPRPYFYQVLYRKRGQR